MIQDEQINLLNEKLIDTKNSNNHKSAEAGSNYSTVELEEEYEFLAKKV